MKTKTYVLTLSRTFPKGHPREGEETGFEGKSRCGIYYGKRIGDNSRLLAKLHTIRANYDLWKSRIDEVNAGEALLSVRQWLGAPRRSKQRELFRLDRDSGIGVEKLDMYEVINDITFVHNGYNFRLVEPSVIAANDGLTLEDWKAWFSNPRYDLTQPMAIIHFTSFRYCK